MKKKNIQGLVSLLLLVIVFSFFLTALNHFWNGAAFEMGGALHLAGLMVCFLIVGTIFFAAKGYRFRMALLILAGGLGGIALSWLNWPLWMEIAVIGGGYLAVCVLFNWRRCRKAVRTINAAAEAYQKDRNGEVYLQTLEKCAKLVPKNTPFQTQDMGTITYWEFLDCTKLQILKDLGRLDERRALIERLRRETKSPGLPAWLDKIE